MHMYQEDWRKEQKDLFYKNTKQIEDCFGPTNDIITYTYIAIYNCKEQKTYTYIVFTPFISGYEKEWDKNQTKPWDMSYTFSQYPSNISYLYMRDSRMFCSKSLYEYIYNKKRDMVVFSYKDYSLQDIDMTFIGNKPVLFSVEYTDEFIQEKTFEEWYKNKNSVTNISLKFLNPQEGFLFRDLFKDIEVRSVKNRLSFDIKII